MRILLSTADLISLVTKHAFTSLVPEAKVADVEVGIMNGEIVAAIAVGEDNFKLKSIKDLQEPLVSGSTPEADQEEVSEEETDTDASKPKRRKRRTKSEIEADKAAEEAAAKAEVEAEAQAQEETDATETQAETEAEVDPFAEPNEADDTAPFDVDEGANLRAENELLPEAKDAAVTEEVDPFADAGVNTSEGDELFAQADTPVSKVVETSEAGFAKPADTEDDPFANFD